MSLYNILWNECECGVKCEVRLDILILFPFGYLRKRKGTKSLRIQNLVPSKMVIKGSE